MGRAALAILSTQNLLHNLAVIKHKAPNSQVIAMVKANAYGHGLRSVALRVEPHVASVGVASIDEALALRKVGIKIPITLMEGIFEPDELAIAADQQFHVVMHNYEQLEWLEHSSLSTPLTLWIKVDTGMGRLGFNVSDVPQVYARLMQCAWVQQPIGCMSHFACADEVDHPLNQQQITAFTHVSKIVNGPKSFCNSAAIFLFADQQHDVVRPGLAMYGVSPVPGISAASFGLRPVMTLQTRLMAVRMMHKGNSLGYGARYTCPEDMPVGVIAMGYGDGYPRSASNGTPVLINGIRCPLIGRVSMDMMTVDLRNYPTAKVQELVVLWGEGLPLEEVAPYTGHSPYDMLTAMQSRVKFYWT